MAVKRKKRLSRKEVLAPDEFLNKSRDILVIIQDYWKHIIGGVVAVIAVTAIALGVEAFFLGQAEAASLDLGRVVEILDAPIVAEGEDPPEGIDGKPMVLHYATEADRYQAASDAVGTLIDQHAGTDLAHTARLLQADVRLGMDDRDGAIKAYEGFLADPPPVPFLRYLAYENLGYAHEDGGDLDAAITQFQQLAAELSDNPLRDEGLFQVGRVQERRGDTDAARQAYSTLVEQYPDSRLKAKAELRLMMLSSGAESAGEGAAAATAPAVPAATKAEAATP